MKLAPRIFTIQNGQLVPKDQNINSSDRIETPYKVVRYSHTVQPAPEEYHTQAIKQYKKQNEELRKKYENLQKAYYGLLGYCQDKLHKTKIDEATPIHQLYKDAILPTCTYITDSMANHSSANISAFSLLEQTIMEPEQQSRKGNRLSESILEEEESIEEFRKAIKEEEADRSSTVSSENLMASGRNAKTEVDEDIEQMLMQAFKEIQELKELLGQVKDRSSMEIEAIRAEYEAKIQNLELLLEKERKQSRMLNGVINRMREQLQSKQNFFRAVKEVKNGPEKNLLQKLLKQHRVSN